LAKRNRLDGIDFKGGNLIARIHLTDHHPRVMPRIRPTPFLLGALFLLILSLSPSLSADITNRQERDGTGATVTKRHFPQGMQQGTNLFFYIMDHLGSIP
jgi:hypothetical protein